MTPEEWSLVIGLGKLTLAKFVSGNNVPVERVVITRREMELYKESIRKEFEDDR